MKKVIPIKFEVQTNLAQVFTLYTAPQAKISRFYLEHLEIMARATSVSSSGQVKVNFKINGTILWQIWLQNTTDTTNSYLSLQRVFYGSLQPSYCQYRFAYKTNNYERIKASRYAFPTTSYPQPIKEGFSEFLPLLRVRGAGGDEIPTILSSDNSTPYIPAEYLLYENEPLELEIQNPFELQSIQIWLRGFIVEEDA